MPFVVKFTEDDLSSRQLKEFEDFKKEVKRRRWSIPELKMQRYTWEKEARNRADPTDRLLAEMKIKYIDEVRKKLYDVYDNL